MIRVLGSLGMKSHPYLKAFLLSGICKFLFDEYCYVNGEGIVTN